MTRFWSRMGGPSDELDPALARLLPPPDPPQLPDAPSLARARIAIESRLERPPPGDVLQRLAFGGAGGTEMWAGLVGAAAAHKAAAAAVGVSVLLGGTVVESTGVGPAVRESVRHALVAESENEQLVLANATETPTPLADAPATPEVPAATGTPEAVELAGTFSADEQSLPGNLVTQLHPQGRFSIRAQIGSATGTLLTLMTVDGELELDVAGARVHTTGAPSDGVEWSEYVGFGVFVTGTCALPAVDEGSIDETEDAESSDVEAADVALTDCESLEVVTVQVLGRAGQDSSAAGPPEHAGKPETLEASSADGERESTEDGDAEATGVEGQDSTALGGHGRGRAAEAPAR